MPETATVYTKCWVAYLKVIIGLVLLLGALIALHLFQPEWAGAMQRNGLSSQVVYYGFLGVKIILGLLILGRVWRLLLLRTFRLEVGDDVVSVRHGLLPWTKVHRSWDGDQIYDCLFYRNGIIGWLTRSGDLEIVGTEGSTHKFRMEAIGRVEQACAAVAGVRRQARQVRRAQLAEG